MVSIVAINRLIRANYPLDLRMFHPSYITHDGLRDDISGVIFALEKTNLDTHLGPFWGVLLLLGLKITAQIPPGCAILATKEPHFSLD